MAGRDGANRCLISTARLRLRPVCVADLDALYRIWTDPAVRRFFWDGEVIPKERAKAAVRKGGEDFARHGFGLWVATGKRAGVWSGSAACATSTTRLGSKKQARPEGFCGAPEPLREPPRSSAFC